MMTYSFVLAVAAGVMTLSSNTLHAAPACCSASQSVGKELAAVTSDKVNNGMAATGGAEVENSETSGTTTTSATQELKLEVTTSYSPSVLTVEKGKPVVLKVHRKDANNCGGELLIPDFDVRAKLPVGQTTEVMFTPTKAGTFPFTCGMQMMNGQIVVK